jgi:hypothetical protein
MLQKNFCTCVVFTGPAIYPAMSVNVDVGLHQQVVLTNVVALTNASEPWNLTFA